MSRQHPEAVTDSIREELSLSPGSIAEASLRRVFGELDFGELVIEFPSGHRQAFGGRRAGPQGKLSIHSWRCLWRLFSHWDIGFAEAYIAGELSSPNLPELLQLACNNRAKVEPLRFLRAPRVLGRLRHVMNRNTRNGSRRNIAAHYDLGNEFYQQWLDSTMTYSAGLFCSRAQTLEQAQHAKLDRVITLLELTDGDQVLEIGCGWGSLAERIMERNDCKVTGVTLSAQQFEFAQRRLRDREFDERSSILLEDYRDVRGTYDRIVSIEMLEAVGEVYWPTYFEKLHDRLRPGGVAVMQVITIDEDRFEDYRRRPDFIQKYIFPGGMLPTAGIIERETVKAGLRLVEKEFFGDSYARTLEQWRRRFLDSWPKIEALGFDERFKRAWEYYLAYCQVGFETGIVNVGLYKAVKSASFRWPRARLTEQSMGCVA
jgi:cyclopropane-fatty-acyl-phospholipid synthase